MLAESVSPSAGMGLLTMRRRAEIIGASFDGHAAPGEGTEIQCRIAKNAA
jgi:signal transduction histidine kinase